MTSSIHDALTPPERVAHLMQQWYQFSHEMDIMGRDTAQADKRFELFLFQIIPADIEAIDELLKDYDRYRERAKVPTHIPPKQPASMWRSKLLRDNRVAIILASVEGTQPFGNGLKVFMTNGNYVTIEDYPNAEGFLEALAAYREWRDATD